MTLPLELVGAELIEVLVTPNLTVETLNVIEDFRLDLGPCVVDPLLDQFALEVAEEELGNRVIPAVTPTTRAWTESVVFAQRLSSSLPN